MFHLFAYSTYYPCGGIDDYRGCFATMEAAKKALEEIYCDNWEIVTFDNTGFQIVERQ